MSNAARLDHGSDHLGQSSPGTWPCAVRGNACTTGTFEAVDLQDNAENLCGLGR